MNTTVKWLLIGAVVAYFFRQQIEAALGISTTTAAPATTATTTAPVTTAPASNLGPATTAASSSQTYQLMLNAAQNDANYIANSGRMSAYQWNYYYTLVRGIAAPDPTSMGLNGSELMSLQEYWTAATAYGLSGLRRRQFRPRRASLAGQAWSA